MHAHCISCRACPAPLTETMWYVLTLSKCHDKANVFMCTVHNHIFLNYYDVGKCQKSALHV
jgi:hypothetical protein